MVVPVDYDSFVGACEVRKISSYSPMQLRGPKENGKYAHGCLLATSSGKNLSGTNLYGSGQYSSLVCALRRPKTTEVPSGTM